MKAEERIGKLVEFLYPEDAAQVTDRIFRLVREFKPAEPGFEKQHRDPGSALTENDAILITYGDQVQAAGEPPLKTLASFLEKNLADILSGVHILPFFPYSSDDGFSVIDYRQVDQLLGSWQDISRLGRRFRLMFDAVVNHVSSESVWFQKFLEGDPAFSGYFLTVPNDQDLRQVVRPRALPLLTRFEAAHGDRFCWTTFSEDQVDLNYANPQILLEMIDLLLFYVSKGAEFIRLDAIAYLWKEIGTPCIHLPETHAVVKLFRAVLDLAAPQVLLITETNVPHEQNLSYFGSPLANGKRTDEAQLVYQFPLAPLLLHTFLTGESGVLSNWVESLAEPPPGGTFFNFTASHDGIGVRPAENLLSQAEIDALVERTFAHGGTVSNKDNPDGSQSPYELNITWYDALNDPARPNKELDVRRFLASQAIMLSLQGVPGIYFHSLFGMRNCLECYARTGRARSLNREKLELFTLERLLVESTSHYAKVFEGYRRMLAVRKEQPAFHPRASQQTLRVGEGIFGLVRSAGPGQTVICLVEVSGQSQRIRLSLSKIPFSGNQPWRSLLDGQHLIPTDGYLEIDLVPYEVIWAKPQSPVPGH